MFEDYIKRGTTVKILSTSPYLKRKQILGSGISQNIQKMSTKSIDTTEANRYQTNEYIADPLQ